MKKSSLFLTLTICVLISSRCKEKEPKSLAPSNTWQFDFFLADSLGNNLLPYPLPTNPIRIPNEYQAQIIPSGKSLYYSNRFTKQFGYTFVFYDLIPNFKENGESYVYKIDPKTKTEHFNTMFSVQLCFKDKCDTLKFCADLSKIGLEHKNIKYYVADWIIRKNDTIFNVSEEVFPLYTKF